MNDGRRAPELPEERPPTKGDPVGGEVGIGGGPAPRWLRPWFYIVYVWAILYLLIQNVAQYWLVALFAALLLVWLGYIAWKKRPPEP
ncbi:MAG: hypothetical protein U0531_02050 [Dehalococcoidia bacterium]